jgi:hypothetical protein
MDAATFERFYEQGLTLSSEEITAIAEALQEEKLPCLDLLRAIHRRAKRVEQEVITQRGCVT